MTSVGDDQYQSCFSLRFSDAIRLISSADNTESEKL